MEIDEAKLGKRKYNRGSVVAAAGLLVESKYIRGMCYLLSALRTLAVKLHSFPLYSGMWLWEHL